MSRREILTRLILTWGTAGTSHITLLTAEKETKGTGLVS